MPDYQTQTVAQLKEALKAKNLSTGGVKADLIARLIESDKAEPKEKETAPAVVEPAEKEPIEESKPVEESSEPSTLTVIQPVKKEAEAPKVLTPEERKKLAIELINKKINRAKKFGNEQEISAFEKDLARVEKFGVELGTNLAREIGIIDNSLSNKSNKSFKHNNNKFKNKNRNFKKRFKN